MSCIYTVILIDIRNVDWKYFCDHTNITYTHTYIHSRWQSQRLLTTFVVERLPSLHSLVWVLFENPLIIRLHIYYTYRHWFLKYVMFYLHWRIYYKINHCLTSDLTKSINFLLSWEEMFLLFFLFLFYKRLRVLFNLIVRIKIFMYF